MKRQASGQVVSIPWERRLGGGQVTGVGAGYGREGKWLGREKPLLSSSPGWTLKKRLEKLEGLGERPKEVPAVCVTSGRSVVAD